MTENEENIFMASAELRSYIENDLEDNNDDIHKHAGLVDSSEDLEVMNAFASMYEPSHDEMPYDFYDTKAGKTMKKNLSSEFATKAVKAGSVSMMKYVTGMQSYKKDASGLHTLRKLIKQLKKDAYISYLFGHMGNGKTDFANLMGEIAKEELGYEIASNQKSLEEKDEYIWTYGGFLNWLADGHDITSIKDIQDLKDEGVEFSADNKLFIFDEGSNHASGYQSDAHDAQELLGKLVKLIRKVGGNMLIIGHTGKDVHPDIRRLSNDCIHKTGKKTAKYYESVEESEGKGLKFSVSAIPKTNWEYDTLEICKWSWSIQSKGEQNEMAEEITSGVKRDTQIVKAAVTNEHSDIEPNEKGEITYDMLGDYYGITPQRVSQIVKKKKEKIMEMNGGNK